MEAFVNQQQGFDGGDDVYCVVGGGDDFSVDDFINFETEDEDQIKEKEDEEEEEEEEEDEAENSNSSSSLASSVVSFEPPPVSELTLPAHDVAELEWVSRIMDDSLSEFPATYEAAPKIGTHQHATPPPPPVPVKAKRSKRTRTASGLWAPLHLTDSTSSSTTTTTTSSTSSCSSPSYSSQLIFAHSVFDEIPLPALKKQKPKKRGRKPKQPNPLEPNNSSTNSGERRCSHCGVNKTPQWRTGPMGAKTLCNACGVRYKSGRLLPEYRPACSPTFVSHVHSNSHRKVLEMRRKKEEEDKLVFISAAPPVASF